MEQIKEQKIQEFTDIAYIRADNVSSNNHWIGTFSFADYLLLQSSPGSDFLVSQVGIINNSCSYYQLDTSLPLHVYFFHQLARTS